MSKLIIAEKPSVAKSIASALGASSRADGFYAVSYTHLDVYKRQPLRHGTAKPHGHDFPGSSWMPSTISRSWAHQGRRGHRAFRQ